MTHLTLALIVFAVTVSGQPKTKVLPLEKTDGLRPQNVKLEPAEHRGRKAVRVLPDESVNGRTIALLPYDFRNGTLEIDVAGQPTGGAFSGARGFVGLAFRVAEDGRRFECFYLRPTNGRADDQLRRNHSTQYISAPDWPWDRLRKESPGVYESYADLEPGAWTKMKIVVTGRTAQLYVHDASQPCLIVNDLKLGETSGALALWVGPGTDGYFSNLRVSTSSE